MPIQKEQKQIPEFRGQYAFLSNFYLCTVYFEGVGYPSVEHAYQAAKTTDIKTRLWIRDSPAPGIAKRRGRQIPLREDWGRFNEPGIRDEIMRQLVREKFRSSRLRNMLLDTGEAELIEGNWWNDFYWGVCDGKGENMLGKILMEVREELRNGK